MTNMFPGDSRTQYYRLNVSFTGTVTVNFQVNAANGDRKLGEVLQAQVRLVDTDEVLYEGNIADLLTEHVLTTDGESQMQELFYEVTIGLGTDVGNEYQNLSMPSVELSWWLEYTPDQRYRNCQHGLLCCISG